MFALAAAGLVGMFTNWPVYALVGAAIAALAFAVMAGAVTVLSRTAPRDLAPSPLNG